MWTSMRIRGKQAEALADEIAANPGKAVEIGALSDRGIRATFDGQKPITIGGRGKVTRG
jgi:hypothetical protein